MNDLTPTPEAAPGTDLADVTTFFQGAREAVSRAVSGAEVNLDLALVALICEGHLLLEGPPGTGKTLLALSLSRLLGLDFKRLQLTPDLLPADIIGTHIFNNQSGDFELRRGPIFTDLLLADEINRAPAKTQAALLQAMQEREVTIDGDTLPLGQTFMVIATQNPIEMEGTYPLPEAQLDRFFFKLLVDYPSLEAEEEILHRYHNERGYGARIQDVIEPLVDGEALRRAREVALSVDVRPEVVNYVARLVSATRRHPAVMIGASPRGGVMLLSAAKCWAAKEGRGYVIPDDVKAVAPPGLRHRLILQPGAQIDGLLPDDVVKELLSGIEVPR